MLSEFRSSDEWEFAPTIVGLVTANETLLGCEGVDGSGFGGLVSVGEETCQPARRSAANTEMRRRCEARGRGRGREGETDTRQSARDDACTRRCNLARVCTGNTSVCVFGWVHILIDGGISFSFSQSSSRLRATAPNCWYDSYIPHGRHGE
jgi:hypothetical protein